jgi:hypothetical protein
LGQKNAYDPPEVGTVFPLRSNYAEDFRLDFVKKVASVLENMNLISLNMKSFGHIERMKIRIDEYVNKIPVRKQKGCGIDGGKQVSVFHPDSFLPFFMNSSGSRISRLCNGNHTIGEIITRSKGRRDVAEETLVEDVMKFLLLLEELDLIEFRR